MKAFKYWAMGGTAALLFSCGTLDMSSDSGPAAKFSAMRRAFANDSAANDSLPGGLVRDGVKFILQPGKNYGLRMESSVFTDKLGLYLYENGALKNWGTYSAQNDGGAELFELRSDRLRADFFVAVLQNSNPATVAARIGRVRLFPLLHAESPNLEVHLLLVRQISTLPTTGLRSAFADKFLADLKILFATYGVTLTVSYLSVEPDSPPTTVPFNGTYTVLPGARFPGAINLYLVDNISSGSALGSILGFAPREALDLSTDPDSRVILNGRANESLLVTTAAHEMGHFFGLRHTTATNLDMSDDGDLSNKDDGFSSTPACSTLSKISALPSLEVGSPSEGSRYCPFQSMVSCPASCDVTNLMFAYDCPAGTSGQRSLSTEQKVFVRSNLALLQP